MTLQEAIEIKHREREGYSNYGAETIDEADRLLIEAGKRIVELHEDDELLPGETESGEIAEE